MKIFDYTEHLMADGFSPVVCTDDEFDASLPLFAGDRFLGVRPDNGVPYAGLRDFGLHEEDWVLFSWPTHYEHIVKRTPSGFRLQRVVHMVQNVRHANPTWLDGYATRLLARPMSRAFVATPVLEVCQPYLNPNSLSIVIPEGHRWEYFHKARVGGLTPPIRVGYTTWKSDVGEAVAKEVSSDDRFEFLAITEPATWAELRDLYHWSDVFLATPGAEEGFYLPGIEAMSAGALVLTPDAGGNMEYCRFGVNCLEVELEQPASYVVALNEVAELGEAETDGIRRSAYETLEKHTLDSERSQLIDFVHEIEASTGGAA